MKNWNKLLYALYIGILLEGLTIVLTWGHESDFLGLGLVIISLLMIYINYIKDKKEVAYIQYTNIKNIFLGLFLIFFDVSFNLYSGDDFSSFDFGMIFSGLFLILLNMNTFRFLRLEKEMINFVTYFIFIIMLLIGSIGTGLTFILNGLKYVPDSNNPINIIMTEIAIKNAVFFLDFVKPTRSIGNLISFDTFSVGIAYPCSGIESITVFLSAVVAYFIAIEEKNVIRIFKYSFIGIIALYFMNILRIMILVLIGYSFGSEAMLFTHTYLGWIMFSMGMVVFWYLIMKK